VQDVLLEVRLGLEHVADQAAEEGDVGAGADRHVLVGQGARAREAGVDVDDLRPALTGLHHPAEADRVRLRHRVALDDHAVGVLEVLLERGGAAAT
jgi:microcompartment protein CcmK/EutM